MLLGVTRSKVIEVIQQSGMQLHFEPVKAEDLASFDAAFISGTSPKILPIAEIGHITYDVNDPALREIMDRYANAESMLS